jgi:ABC-type transporter Mla subunit MlaD
MKKTVLHSLTGVFVLAAFLVAGIAVISRPTLLGWFGRIRTCETWLPEAYVKKGDAVEFRSFAVGRVIDVEAHPWNTERGRDWFKVTLAIEHDWIEAITDQFTLTVSVGPLGALTGSNLVLLAPEELVTLDVANPAVKRGRPLKSYDDEAVELVFNDPMSLLDEFSERARDVFDRVGPQAEELIVRAQAVIDELGREDGDLRTFVRHLRDRAEGLDLLLDDASLVLQETHVLVRSLNDPEGSVQRALADVADSAARVDTASRTLPGLAEEVRRAVEQTNRVLVGLRESSLVNLFVDLSAPPPGAPLTLPAALGGGAR